MSEQKLIETNMNKQLCRHLDKQSALRENHSCESLILEICDMWLSALEEPKYVIAEYLDFRRAFGTINCNKQILLHPKLFTLPRL